MELILQYAKRWGEKLMPCTRDSVMLLKRNADRAEMETIFREMTEAGCERWSVGTVEENLCAVLRHGNVVYTLSYTDFEHTIRLIADPTTDLPDREVSTEEICTPLVTQMRLLYFGADCGMVYIIRLTDGRFIIIDGGMGEFDEPVHMMDLLRQQNVRDGVPVIAAWFFTHPHNDHFCGFTELMKRYRDELVLESIVYNWPTRDMAKGFSSLTEFEALVPTLTGTKKITPRDGWCMIYPGASFQILYTCEDLYPTPFPNMNDTSMVMRMDMAGRRVLWMGDASGIASEYMCGKYSAETLACEIMQVGHHGYWGGSDRLHRTVDPEVLLWPCPDFWYQVITDWECNRYLVESEKIHTIYVSGQQENVIDMTAPITPIDPYPAPENGILYHEDFADPSIFAKGWACITGGRTGYRGMGITTEPGVCRYTAGEARSVLEWVQPGRMTDSYRLTFRCRKKACEGMIGLFWNHPVPTEWSDELVLMLDLPEEACTVTLTADAGKGEAVLAADGKTVCTMPYTPAPKHGLYLLMQNAALDVYEITVTALD